jgi:hypothetical protein
LYATAEGPAAPMASSVQAAAKGHLGAVNVFKNETAQARNSKGARSRGLLGLAAAASLSVMAIAGHASASQEIQISDVEMDQTYTAHITGLAEYPGGVDVYSNGVQFTAKFIAAGNPTDIGAVGSTVPNLFGFCIDVYHNISLGHQTLYYSDNEGSPNPLATDNGGNALSPTIQAEMTNLIDTGFILHEDENASNHDDTEMRLAAIQAAIWQTEVPSITVTVNGGGQYLDYFKYYTGNGATPFVPLNDANDRVYTITDINSPSHQNFAIGWPIGGVPEPTTWAMMLTGFFGMGAVLRRQRKTAAAVA